jgi:hypothetical protein
LAWGWLNALQTHETAILYYLAGMHLDCSLPYDTISAFLCLSFIKVHGTHFQQQIYSEMFLMFTNVINLLFQEVNGVN